MNGVCACSALTVTLLWMLARRNRAQGWRRERHPNCFSPLSRSAPSAGASRAWFPQGGAPKSNVDKNGHPIDEFDVAFAEHYADQRKARRAEAMRNETGVYGAPVPV